MRVVDNYKPELIISLHAPLGCVNISGPSHETGKRISRLTGLPLKEDIGYPTPGSMGNYYGVERNVQVITLELPNQRGCSQRCVTALLDALSLPFKSAKSSVDTKKIDVTQKQGGAGRK
jgi:hypothetical protein